MRIPLPLKGERNIEATRSSSFPFLVTKATSVCCTLLSLSVSRWNLRPLSVSSWVTDSQHLCPGFHQRPTPSVPSLPWRNGWMCRWPPGLLPLGRGWQNTGEGAGIPGGKMPTVSQGLASGNRPTGRDGRPMMGGRGRDEAPKLM